MPKKKAHGKDELENRLAEEGLYIAPASKSEARANALLPSKGSEDVSDLLGSIDLPIEKCVDDENRQYLPNEANEWILDIRFKGDPVFTAAQVQQAFYTDWQEHYGSGTIFGLDADRDRWTFALSSDGPKRLTRLKLALTYYCSWTEDAGLSTVGDFRRRERTACQDAGKLGKATVTPNIPAEQAAQRARDLRDLKRKLDLQVAIVLKAPRGQKFDGRSVWDVMLCLGLHWGDMDCFHWQNPSESGDDSFFSVWTSTPPGYFFPEEIAANRVHVDDLVFGFSVPRCARPLEVFEGMLRAVQYCRHRLGGQVLGSDGGPADPAEYRRVIGQVAQTLTEAGFSPGTQNALMLF